MTIPLDPSLVLRVRRKPTRGALTPEQRIAINLLWRKTKKARIIAKIFKIAPNTIYYQCLTGEAESYNVSRTRGVNAAREVNHVIDQMGEEKAWHKYVTDDMVKALHTEMEAEAKRRGT